MVVFLGHCCLFTFSQFSAQYLEAGSKADDFKLFTVIFTTEDYRYLLQAENLYINFNYILNGSGLLDLIIEVKDLGVLFQSDLIYDEILVQIYNDMSLKISCINSLDGYSTIFIFHFIFDLLTAEKLFLLHDCKLYIQI